MLTTLKPGGGVRAVRRMMSVLLAVGLAVVVVGLALRTYLNRPVEDRLAPDEAVSIADLSRPLTTPSFLACPPGYCAAAADIGEAEYRRTLRFVAPQRDGE